MTGVPGGAPTGEPPMVHLPPGLHWQSRFFAATHGFWRQMARLESAAVRDLTRGVTIDRPIYVTSLARSGTTIVTEMLERHPDVTTHRYSDFPNVWTPYWRNYLLQRTRRERPRSVERAHFDRIEVSNDSPEAVEEVLWMAFFPEQHQPERCQVLDARDRNPAFDDFYRDHLRKLLAVRGARRYLAKGNYHIARLRYLLALFPDARFLVPVREPVQQIASLMKQHALFTRSSKRDPRIARQLALAGHFEFGPGRRAVHYGDYEATRAIVEAWQDGREVEGWSRCWAATYGHVLDQLDRYPDVRRACLLFHYEDLCTDSARLIDRILAHCELDSDRFSAERQRYIEKLSLPDYYQPWFDAADLEQIDHHCAAVWSRLLAVCAEAV